MSEPPFPAPAPAPSTRSDGATASEPAPGLAVSRAHAAASELLAPGTVIARFIVHRTLGAGSAGVVYAAHDPELDRTIALKVLRRDVAERRAPRLRFLREAQALARLSHPNVISVYDVGATGGHTFIAMEYIHGCTFADWTAAAPRAWPEIVDVLVKAGRGLAAAHAAGLIHRDFKPANLLVGDDGRVVVTDFGLARAVEAVSDDAEPDAPAGGQAGSALAVAITRTGAMQGTPAYMAPEQAVCHAADARADQFSFCVTLYEAMFGVRPFLPRRAMALASTPTTETVASGVDPDRAPGAARPPSDDRRVPAWLQRAVQRGLCERPEDRHPSMDSLLAVLNHEPVRRRRRIQLAVGATAVVLLAAGIAAYAMRRDPSVALCAGAAHRLAGIWNPGTRAEVRAAFDATGLPYATDARRRVEPILDSYVAQWAAMHTDACRATRVLGEQSELLMDRRMACLDVRRRELDQLSQLLRKPDADIVEHAVGAARGLSSIQGCGDLAALTRSIAPPPDPGTAARVTAARQNLAEARVLHDAGKYTEGLALVDRLAAEQVTRDYLPLRAEVAYTAGRLRVARSEWSIAATRLDDAIWAAEASGHDEIAVAALSSAAVVLSELDRFKEAADVIRRGEAALLRMTARPLARAEYWAGVCHAFEREGRLAEARQACQQALDLRRHELGPDHPEVAMSLYRLGLLAGSYEHADSDQQGLGYFREALAIEERALGPDHPEVEHALTAMSRSEVRLGRLDDALEHSRRALAIAERAFGTDSMRVFTALSRMGDVQRRRGQNAEAAAAFRRALAIADHTVGPEHSQAGLAHTLLGDALQAETDYASALQHYRRAAAIYEATIGTAHPNHAIVVLDICSMEFELKRRREALADCTRGLAGLERAVGSASLVADALVGMVDRVYAANGRMSEAFAALDRGIAIWRKEDPTAPVKIADGELTLAQTIWDSSPPDRPRARALAVRARDRLGAGGPGSDAKRADIEAWLAAHGGPAARR